ncbi:hypothetical protein ACA910_004863 [Epithemia clementina (nom. ined.)]
MAALTLPATACYEVHENVRVDTSDNEDHTFCGIMFPIQAKADLPVSRLVIRSVSVRGELGAMTVWVSNEDAVSMDTEYDSVNILHQIRADADCWTKIYDKSQSPSRRKYKALDLSSNPIILEPGQMRVIYIHSAAQNDLGIVYDNSQSKTYVRYTDNFLTIHSGAAHLSPDPFHGQNIWGWGSAWRDYREFVGQIDFGAVYQLWSPERHHRFGSRFQDVTTTMLACQRRVESPLSMLPDECIYYILNMCRWDWFEDTADQISSQRRKRQRSERPKRIAAEGTELSSERSTSMTRRPSRRWRLSFIGGVREKIINALS